MSGEERSEKPPDSSIESAQEPLRHTRLIRAVVSQVKAELRISGGPLPPPEMLAAYKEAFPDCPERIVAMGERESRHRQELELTDLSAAIDLRKKGQIIGAILAMTALLGGIYLLGNDKSVAGYGVLLGSVAVFGGAFVYDRFINRGQEPIPKVKASKTAEVSEPRRDDEHRS